MRIEPLPQPPRPDWPGCLLAVAVGAIGATIVIRIAVYAAERICA